MRLSTPRLIAVTVLVQGCAIPLKDLGSSLVGYTADGEEPEHTAESSGNTGYSEGSAAESGASGREIALLQSDLMAVVEA
jgi:hypothetical protein